jgi:hypothetical protein
MSLVLMVFLGFGVWVVAYGPLDPPSAHAAEYRADAASLVLADGGAPDAAEAAAVVPGEKNP